MTEPRDDLARVRMTYTETKVQWVTPENVETFERGGWTRGSKHVLTYDEAARAMVGALSDIDAYLTRGGVSTLIDALNRNGIGLVRTKQEAES